MTRRIYTSAIICAFLISVFIPKPSRADIIISGCGVRAGDSPYDATQNLFCGSVNGVASGTALSGSLTVNGGDSVTSYYHMIFGFGSRQASGDMEVTGGSSVTNGAGLSIGSDGDGSLYVSEGSTVEVLNGPIPFFGFFFEEPGSIIIGTFGGSNGTAIVTGIGSELISHRGIGIGAGSGDTGGGDAAFPGRGSLSVSDGASVSSVFMNIGLRETGIGDVNLLSASLNLSGVGADGAPAFLTVGRTATGTLTANDSNILIDGQLGLGCARPSGFNIGRDSPAVGQVNLINQSSLIVSGDCASGNLGRRGSTGSMNITDSQVIIEDTVEGRFRIAPEPGGKGVLNIYGQGALLDAGSIFTCGVDTDGTIGGTGEVFIDDGATLRAVTILIGPDCKVKGKGTIEGTVTVYNGAKIHKKVVVSP